MTLHHSSTARHTGSLLAITPVSYSSCARLARPGSQTCSPPPIASPISPDRRHLISRPFRVREEDHTDAIQTRTQRPTLTFFSLLPLGTILAHVAHASTLSFSLRGRQRPASINVSTTTREHRHPSDLRYSARGSGSVTLCTTLFPYRPHTMPLFSRLRSKGATPAKEKHHAEVTDSYFPPPPPAPPKYQSTWTSTQIVPEEVEELIHYATTHMRSRGKICALPYHPRVALTVERS